jgi:biotin carboxyl carrier protein
MEIQSRPKLGTVAFQKGDEVTVVNLERAGEAVQIAIADRFYEVNAIYMRKGEVAFNVDGVAHTAYVASHGSVQYIAIDGEEFELKKPAARRARRKSQHGEDSLSASMPGQVTKVLVSAGDSVQRGQPLLVLEAMKMEIKIAAPHDGRVVQVLVRPGEVVDRGQGLVEMIDDQLAMLNAQ